LLPELEELPAAVPLLPVPVVVVVPLVLPSVGVVPVLPELPLPSPVAVPVPDVPLLAGSPVEDPPPEGWYVLVIASTKSSNASIRLAFADASEVVLSADW
jgi:hypothetical protein